MRLRALIAAGSLLLTAAAPEEATPETRVLSAVTRLRQALESSDRKALEALIAPGFVMVHATGAVESAMHTWRAWRGERWRPAAG